MEEKTFVCEYKVQLFLPFLLKFANFPYYFRDARVEFKAIGFKIRE